MKKASWQAKVVKLGDILANFEDLQNSGYDFTKQKVKVKKKIPYVMAIRSGIKSNRNKIPNLQKVQLELNLLLKTYKQKPIFLL